MPPRNPPADVDPVAAKQTIVEYCQRKGALIAGVADLAAVERIAPAGHRPSDLMPRVKSVIAVGVGGATQGAWRVPAKALSYFGSTESRAYKIVYGLAFFIEQKFGAQAIYCPPDMDPELGALSAAKFEAPCRACRIGCAQPCRRYSASSAIRIYVLRLLFH